MRPGPAGFCVPTARAFGQSCFEPRSPWLSRALGGRPAGPLPAARMRSRTHLSAFMSRALLRAAWTLVGRRLDRTAASATPQPLRLLPALSAPHLLHGSGRGSRTRAWRRAPRGPGISPHPSLCTPAASELTHTGAPGPYAHVRGCPAVCRRPGWRTGGRRPSSPAPCSPP